MRTVAAFEVPLPTEGTRNEFLRLLGDEAKVKGFHLDYADSDQLKSLSEITPMTLHAAVWKGANDDENVASAMDFKDHLGKVWITFAKGKNPQQFKIFRDTLMTKVHQRWPQTMSLPIAPTGAIPNPDDLLPTADGYQVKPSAVSKYQL